MLYPEDIANAIDIKVATHYLDELSKPNQHCYGFAYTITIHNNSPVPTKLLKPHWVIANSDGEVGVVMTELADDTLVLRHQQPRIEPNQSYQYTHSAIVKTPYNIIHGCHEMVTDHGFTFKTKITSFSLIEPELRFH